jgi:hypothetical protein
MVRGDRADNVEYARRVNAAADLVGSGMPVASAAHKLARRYGVSVRQARRYVEQAMATGRVDVPEATVVFTVRLPGTLAGRVRAHAHQADVTISAAVTRALVEFLEREAPGRRDGP